VLKVLAATTDYVALVEAGWRLMRSGATAGIGGTIDALSYLLDGLDWLLKKLGMAGSGWGKTGHDLAKGMYDTAHEEFLKAGADFDQFMRGTNSKNAARALASIQDASQKAAESIAADAAKLNGAGTSAEDWAKKLEEAAQKAKKVTETLAELHKQVDSFGMTEGQKKALELKGLGATPEQLAEAQKLADTLDRLTNAKKATDSIKDLEKELSQLNFTDAQKRVADLKLPGVDDSTLAKVKELAEKLDAMKEGKSVFDETRSPLEKYETRIGKLSDLLNSGAIDWDTYGRAVRQAREQLEQAAKASAPELFQANTAAADKYLYEQKNTHAFDFTAGGQKHQQDKDKDALQQEQYNEVFQSRLILQRIENSLNDANAVQDETVDFI
jgi:hypothetical protein